ncbi:MAG: response regulator transcription factor [Clostridiales bacterium]|nr:response regulator transcription factor [Clostridiales bacterium]
MKMPRQTVLIVDDEKGIVEVVRDYLLNAGFHVLEAYNGRDALALFDQMAPDLLILDLMLPDITGEEVCRVIRRKSRVPIIMLTAKVAEADLLKGFNLGADDYVTKPFSPRQLLARVQAILRRVSDEAYTLSDQLSFNHGDLVIDSLRHEVRKAGETVALTPIEFKILASLGKYPTKVFTREELISLALEDDYQGNDRVIDSHIKNIRQKIEDDTRDPQYIQTVHGIGYKFGGGS